MMENNYWRFILDLFKTVHTFVDSNNCNYHDHIGRGRIINNNKQYLLKKIKLLRMKIVSNIGR